jgi:hypothetical protein
VLVHHLEAMRKLVLLALALALVGCGGGGGGGGGSSAPPPVAATVNPPSITLTKSVAEAAGTASFTVTPTVTTTGGALYGRVDFSGDAVAQAGWMNPGETVAVVQVSFPHMSQLRPGDYTGQVRFHLCDDDRCNRPVAGSPVVVPVRLTAVGVTPVAATASPTQLVARAMQGMPFGPARATTTLTFERPVAGTPVVGVSSTSSLIFDVAGVMTSPTTMEVTVRFTAADALSIGVHADVLPLNVCYSTDCTNQVISAPVPVGLTYTVDSKGPIPEPGVAPLVPLRTTGVPHDVVDAEYSKALDAVVTVSSYPDDALYVYDVARDSERRVPLTAVPTALSISLDGEYAAVGHDRMITYVELRSAGSPNAPPPVLLDVSIYVHDLVADGRGYVHAWSHFSLDPVSVRIDTNVASIGRGLSGGGNHMRLHPSGDYTYSATLSTASVVEKWDIRTAPTTTLYGSPYDAEHPTCLDIWLDQPGSRIFTACGSVLRTSTLQADDMIFTSSLALSQPAVQFGGYKIRSLSHSEPQREIALVEYTEYFCDFSNEWWQCFSHLALYDADGLNRIAVYSFAPMSLGNTSYRQSGLFVFHDSTGTRKFIISRLHDVPDASTEHYISEF